MFRLPRIPILQRYVLRDLLIVFFFLLSVVTVLLVFVGVFKEMSATGLRPLQALQILPFIVPSLLPFTIPATLLLTVWASLTLALLTVPVVISPTTSAGT